MAFISIHTGHSFMSGYNIPEPLKNEYELLWQLIHNPAKNIEATENFATCIGTRGEQIRALTTQYADELILIGPNPELNRQRLAAANARLDALLQDFDAQLSEKVYEGFDGHLKVNAAIMARYKQMIQIESIADLEQLEFFQPEVLKSLLAEQVIPIPQFTGDDFDEFLIYLVHTPAQILDLILPCTRGILNGKFMHLDYIFDTIGTEKTNLLIKHLVLNVEDFITLLHAVSDTTRSRIFKEIKDKISQMNINSYELWTLLRILNPEQCRWFCNAIKDKMPQILPNIRDFNIVVASIGPEQCVSVCQAMKDKVPGMITSIDAFKNLFKLVKQPKMGYVFELVEQKLPDLIHSPKELCVMLDEQGIELCSLVCKALKDKLPGVILNAKGLSTVITFFNGKHRSDVTGIILKEMEECLPQMINSFDDLMLILSSTTEKQFESTIKQSVDVYKVLVDNRALMITDRIQFLNLIKFLSLTEEEIKSLLQALPNISLPSLFKNVHDFTSAIKDLNSLERRRSLRIIKKCLPIVIKSWMDLAHLIRNITEDELNDVYTELKPNLLQIIEKNANLLNLLEDQAEGKLIYFYQAVKSDIHRSIHTASDFKNVLERLNEECRRDLFERMKDDLPSKIHDSLDFNYVLKYLTIEQRNTVYDSMNENVENMINRCSDLIYILEYLTQEQRNAVYDRVKDRLPEMIESSFDMKHLFKYLTQEQRKEVFERVKVRFPAIIKESFDLATALEFLNEEERTLTLEVLQVKLPSLINDHHQKLTQVLIHLNATQCRMVLNSIKPQLSIIVYSVTQFIEIFVKLNPSQQSAMLEEMQESFHDIVKDVKSLNVLLKQLTSDQCGYVCNELQRKFSEIIRNDVMFWNTFGGLDDEKFTSVCQSFKSYLPEFSTKPQSLSSPFSIPLGKKEIFLKFATEARLEKYTARIESHRTPEGETDFRHGTWFGFFGDNQNRRQSFEFAQSLLDDLRGNESLAVLHPKILDYLKDNSVYSTELNEILQDIQSYTQKKT